MSRNFNISFSASVRTKDLVQIDTEPTTLNDTKTGMGYGQLFQKYSELSQALISTLSQQQDKVAVGYFVRCRDYAYMDLTDVPQAFGATELKDITCVLLNNMKDVMDTYQLSACEDYSFHETREFDHLSVDLECTLSYGEVK